MDRQFLECFGQLFLKAAKDQKQLEDVVRWMKGGFDEYGELTDIFRKFYGLEELPPNTPGYADAFEKASEKFKASFNEWIAFTSVVPKDKYLALEKKYETLKDKIAAQDETIQHLRNLIRYKDVPQADAVKHFTEMLEKQAEQFTGLMERASKAYKKDTD